ncbi:MAG TPA: hypothetical protein VHM25_10060 [Polyangiaceae bacterium]|jgi:hypothetical protein|nr:hypothetical protein [Polyangiaceae bacterium]
MTNFDEELAQLRADVAVPDTDATRRVAARLSRSIGAPGVANGRSGPRGLPWLRPLQLVTTFVFGGIVGAGLYGALRAPRVERVYFQRPPARSEPVVSGAAPFSSAAPVTSAARAVPPLAAAPPSSARSTALPNSSVASDRSASLAEQQALLDVARAAFARSDYSATLRTLTTHSARFPKSVLAEERDALQIKALAASGRVQEARSLASRFQARHPQSLLLPSIKDSVGAIP